MELVPSGGGRSGRCLAKTSGFACEDEHLWRDMHHALEMEDLKIQTALRMEVLQRTSAVYQVKKSAFFRGFLHFFVDTFSAHARLQKSRTKETVPKCAYARMVKRFLKTGP
jgi:hypothetical protein